MNTGIVKLFLVLAALSAISGCSTTSVQTADHAVDRPILSAAEANSMIRVEFRNLESTVVAAAD